MKKSIFISLIWLFSMSGLFSQVVHLAEAEKAATNWLLNGKLDSEYSINGYQYINSEEGHRLAYCFSLYPQGYIVLSADMSLPPVIAYSFTGNFEYPGNEINPLKDIIRADLGSRFAYIPEMEMNHRSAYMQEWKNISDGEYQRANFEQWPPSGSTSTGGWLETNWKQSAPYNKFCPMDEVTGNRSIAGCPAVALAMIIHYQKTLNGTQFSDDDDYFHSYAGRQYWIDNDSHPLEFLSFTEINSYFDSISAKFISYTPLNTNEEAALVFACGVAAQQVYTSEVSGTFGVDQAYDAYMRFGYGDALLIYDSDTSFYTHMKNNIKHGIPVHLALLVNGAGGGHNVVTDGYNTDDYYHLNFGWGGSYNGWYLIPEEIPYNLTIVEGAIMDIGESHVGIKQPVLSEELALLVYPNPSEGKINISLELNESGRARVLICDLKGGTIGKIFEGNLDSGKHQFQWNQSLPSGVYNIVVEINSQVQSKKLIINN